MSKISTTKARGGKRKSHSSSNPTQRLLNETFLQRSSIVANSLMNRERGCLGGNSYERELGFNPVNFLENRLLENRLQKHEQVRWLDLCCGSGRALIEAATLLESQGSKNNLKIIGIDLVSMFYAIPDDLKSLVFLTTSIDDYKPAAGGFDLITCVHGLHYIGDKLGAIEKAAGWLKADGKFLANLDLKNLILEEKQNASKTFSGFLRKQGFTVDYRKHILICNGKKSFQLPFKYLGADDQAGPNYTKQPVVNSFYQ